jgi:hypothetical protein
MTATDFLSTLVPVTFFVLLAIESLFRTGRRGRTDPATNPA